MQFYDNCGAPADEQPTPRTIQPPVSQEPPAAPTGGIANTTIGDIPLYTIMGVCGVALQILSLIIQCSAIYLIYYPLIYDLLNVHPDLTIFVIIGIVGSIIGLLLRSWKDQIVSGVMFLITPIAFVFSWQSYQTSWFVVAFLGGFFMVIAGLLMRTAASYVTYP